MENNVQLVYWRYGSKMQENFSTVRDAAAMAVIISDNGDGFIESIVEKGVTVWENGMCHEPGEYLEEFYERLL